MKINKKLAMIVALGITFSFTAPISLTSIAIAAPLGDAATVDWKDNNFVIVTGTGIAPEGAKRGQKALARRAAMIDAQRNVAEFNGVSVNSHSSLKDLVLDGDIVDTQVNAIVQGYRVVDEWYDADDESYYIQLGIPLYGAGSLSSLVIPALKKKAGSEEFKKVDVTKTQVTTTEVTQIKTTKYTGLIIDASGKNLQKTFSPVIWAEDQRDIYGIKNIDADFAVKQGMVSYASDVTSAKQDPRVGSNPLIIKATETRGEKNIVDVVISSKDADTVLIANESSSFLKECSVVFVN